MIEDRISTAFFTLLRAGLWQRSIDDISCFPLSTAEWYDLFKMSIHQTVEGIIFDGLQQMALNFSPPQDLFITWLVRVEKIAQRNSLMNKAIGQQYALFKIQGLQPLLLKGQGLALCYTNPKRRSCGDIDWYFSGKNAFTQASRCVENFGIKVSPNPGFSSCYLWEGFEVDLHQRMFDIHNPFKQQFLKSIQKSEVNRRLYFDIAEIGIQLPSALEQVLQVNAHILKHLLSYGIGIRQLGDAARTYTYYKDEIDGSALQSIYRELGILDWIDLLHDILVKFIGLSEADLPFGSNKTISADWMMRDICQAGNFGFHDIRYQDLQSKGRTHATQRIWRNFLKYFPHAPMEALSFPFVQFYSKLIK